MKFNKKNKQRPARKRTKPTTGQLALVDIIYMDKTKNDEGVEILFATCTCGGWMSSEDAKTITQIAHEAKAHAQESGHQLRKHD